MFFEMMPVESPPRLFERRRIAIATSSSEQLPARSPRPFTQHSIWRAPI